MTKQEYFDFAEAFYWDALQLSRKKNADYTGEKNDPFSNFTAVETLNITAEQGFLTRMMDKMKRISSFVSRGALSVENETVMDTLMDLANYSCLLAGYIKSKHDDERRNSNTGNKEQLSPEFREACEGSGVPEMGS